jgi:hypothetical protein
VQIAAEAWAEPMPELMLTSSLYATTLSGSYGFRAAAGWRLFEKFWAGPEIGAARDVFSRQSRIGVHLTGLRADAIEWSFAAGYVTDSYGRSGGYGRIGALLRPQ